MKHQNNGESRASVKDKGEYSEREAAAQEKPVGKLCHRRDRVNGLRNGMRLLSLLLILFLFTASGCTDPLVSVEKTDRRVTVVALQQETAPITLSFTGEVVPQELMHISFQVSGRIEELQGEKEMVVTPDTPLGLLDDTDYRTALEGARAELRSLQSQLDLALAGAAEEAVVQAALEVMKAEEAAVFAQDQLSRSQVLFDAGGISQRELEAARLEVALTEASLQQAQQQLNQLERGARQEEIEGLTALRDGAAARAAHYEHQLERTILRSPASGIITAVHYRQGETYMAGTPFITLRSDTPKVQVSATAEELALLQPGNPALMTLGDKTLPGVISLVSTFPDPLTRTYPIDIHYQSTGHLPGAVVSVEVETHPVTGIWVPMSSVMAGDPDYVYVVEQDQALPIPVTVMRASGTRLMVSGLKEGQLLVTAGMSRLSPGDRVVWEKAGDQP